MSRIFGLICAAALSACMFAVDMSDRTVSFASDIFVRSMSFARGLVPNFLTAEPFRLDNSHPRSIFETRRAGLA